MKQSTLGLMLMVITSATVMADSQHQIPSAESKEAHDARMAWWREAKFGMFIHWGVYSVPAGVWNGEEVKSAGEWIMNRGRISVADYQKLPAQFNPVKFNAADWVSIAKNAGMKYIVITAKHHDGFAMFHSKADPFNIYDATPFKRDPLAELAAACKKEGVKLGFYYSQAQDWNHPGGAAASSKTGQAVVDERSHWDTAQQGKFDDYLDKVAVPQLKEVLSNYGDVAELWFDTPKEMTPERAEKIMPLLKLQPNMVVNNRLDSKHATGDFMTPEQKIPASSIAGKDWETCMTMNGTWGYKRDDNNWKSAGTLIRNLCDIASKGGNYLLNVGPTSEGVIPQPSVERLAEIGKWMKVNGEAIYGTGPTPFGAEAGSFSENEKDKDGNPKFVPNWEWRATTKPGRIYVHIFQWPASRSFTLPVEENVSKACLLADPSKSALKVKSGGGKTEIQLPETAPDPIASVIRLELSAK